ncbi:ATP-binding cassette domain-containing protein [Arcanobacterium haemolyticum]|nr:ATP-binding cassette domain-containing protein [Arcanobacterium haemolyticum]
MIRYESVSKSFGESIAVRDFSFTIPSHALVALVGSSGSGKTTLLRMVNRMVTPTSGRIFIDDDDVVTLDPINVRRSIGYVLQHGGLLPHRRVLDNVMTVLRLNGVPRSEAKRRGMEALELVGLDASFADRYPSELSGGQIQRVGVARALVARPNIMLMDEPFGAVDPIVRRELQDELLRLHKELGTTILFVTHDIDEAFRLGDTVVVLSEGGVIEQAGKPEDILTAPATDFVANFVGTPRGNQRLSTANVNGHLVAYDSLGRPVGVLE